MNIENEIKELHNNIKNCKTGCWEKYLQVVLQFANDGSQNLPQDKDLLNGGRTNYQTQNMLNAFMVTQKWVEAGNNFNPCENHQDYPQKFKKLKENSN